ncbi:hypothetical protein RY831_25615 [Noviherbaspirillum sp. CPCC 100848]|uniref:Uncharacterized protein n=1 Tax=Noviherbaspirillum album TaxID=3080276 RepID=A0ABU6JHH4_9BURK|nr:hypothetical protein [Noviherbaspirillum sp. CPCC 100848]MEC4722549.1 hypothetical protein [Noviherbaspirillum sp. CPCC 100848]
MAMTLRRRSGVLSNPKGLDYVRFALKTDGSRIRLVMHCGNAVPWRRRNECMAGMPSFHSAPF